MERADVTVLRNCLSRIKTLGEVLLVMGFAFCCVVVYHGVSCSPGSWSLKFSLRLRMTLNFFLLPAIFWVLGFQA